MGELRVSMQFYLNGVNLIKIFFSERRVCINLDENSNLNQMWVETFQMQSFTKNDNYVDLNVSSVQLIFYEWLSK